MSLDWWFSDGCIKFLYSKFYAFVLKILVICICVFINFYTDIERHFKIIFSLCMYGLLP